MLQPAGGEPAHRRVDVALDGAEDLGDPAELVEGEPVHRFDVGPDDGGPLLRGRRPVRCLDLAPGTVGQLVDRQGMAAGDDPHEVVGAVDHLAGGGLQGVIDVDQHPATGDGRLAHHRRARFGRGGLVHRDEAIAQRGGHAVLPAAGAVVAVDDDQRSRRTGILGAGAAPVEERGVGWQVGIEGGVAQQRPHDTRLHRDRPG